MFVILASPEGSRWAQTTVVRRASRRLCTGRLDGRFGTNLPVSPTVELSSPANFCPSSLVGGVSADGDGPNAYSWTRATQRWHRWTIRPFSSLRPRPRGLGGQGWQECVQLDQGYAPVVSAVDSAIILIFRSPRLEHSQERASFGRGSLSRCGVSSR